MKDIDKLFQDGFAATGRLYEVLFALSQERVQLREDLKRLTEENDALKTQYQASQDMLADALAELTEARLDLAQHEKR